MVATALPAPPPLGSLLLKHFSSTRSPGSTVNRSDFSATSYSHIASFPRMLTFKWVSSEQRMSSRRSSSTWKQTGIKTRTLGACRLLHWLVDIAVKTSLIIKPIKSRISNQLQCAVLPFTVGILTICLIKLAYTGLSVSVHEVTLLYGGECFTGN